MINFLAKVQHSYILVENSTGIDAATKPPNWGQITHTHREGVMSSNFLTPAISMLKSSKLWLYEIYQHNYGTTKYRKEGIKPD